MLARLLSRVRQTARRLAQALGRRLAAATTVLAVWLIRASRAALRPQGGLAFPDHREASITAFVGG